MPPDVLEFIQANAEEYRLCARIVGVTVSYPLDNRCTRCEHISRYALAALERQAAKSNQARGQAEGERAAIVDETRDDLAAKRVARAIMRKLGSEWIMHSELRCMIAARDRRDYFAPALDRLRGAGQIEVDGSGQGTRYRRPEE